MKQQLLYLLFFSNFLYVSAQVFPDTSWEFQGAHATNGTTLFTTVGATSPGPNPAGLDTAVLPTVTGRLSAPVLIDLDGDNDLDMVSGSQDSSGRLYYFENTGTPTAPNWVQTALPTLDAVGFAPGGNNETKCQFIDIDDDGDYDLFYGSKVDVNGANFNDIHYYENTGTATTPNFVASTISDIANQNVANFPSFGFVDLDNDMDFDMVTMGSDSLAYFKNTGTKSAPVFERKFHLENPWDMDAGTGILDRNWPHGDVLTTVPNFIDVDADGDYDMCFGRDGGMFSWIENIGTVSTPDFGTYNLQNFTGDLGLADAGQFSSIAFGDVDGDTVIDAIVGSFNPGYFAWFKGVGSTLGIEQETIVESNIKVSPNPAKDNIQLNLGNNNYTNATLELYSITGQLLDRKIYKEFSNHLELDVSNKQSGLYILKISIDNNVAIIKKITIR
ncbi:T9SS type A sorting domain-containing protein [Pontimicrobium sp. MEBiC01747]